MTSNESDTISIDYSNIYLPREVRFWILLPFNTLSLACSLFHLYHLLHKRVLRIALNNHVIIALIFVGFSTQLLDIPSYIIYLRLGYVWPQSPLFCRFWWYVDIAAFGMTIFLVMWSSLERHVLIFHERWLLTRKKRWILHYLPLVFFTVYPLLFYLLCLILITCDYPRYYDYTQGLCNYSPFCDNDITLVRYDILVNWMSCTIVTFLSDVVLIIRVIWQRRIRLHQPIQWRKHRKMMIQLLSISIFASSFSTPLLIFYLIVYYGNTSSVNLDLKVVYLLLYLYLFSILFLPFIMILSLPKGYWWGKWKQVLSNRQRQRQRRAEQIPLAAAIPVTKSLRMNQRPVRFVAVQN